MNSPALKALGARWMHFWFEPARPLNLGLCRVLFFGAVFLLYLREDFSAWGDVSESFWTPISFFGVLAVPSSGWLALLAGVWRISLVLSCLGLFTRLSTVFSFVLGLYLLGLSYNFGALFHTRGLLVIVLGIVALSRCGDGFSIDNMIRTRRGGGSSTWGSRASGEYTWPVRAVWLMFALVFFAAGLSKLRHSGLEWIFSDNMSTILIWAAYSHFPLVSLGPDLAQYGWLTRLMAATTVLFEIGYPLALFSRRARWVIVPVVFLMLVNIRLLIGPQFYPFMVCGLFWVPWDRVSRAIIGVKRQAEDVQKRLHKHLDKGQQ
jgi:hypothetical protein